MVWAIQKKKILKVAVGLSFIGSLCLISLFTKNLSRVRPTGMQLSTITRAKVPRPEDEMIISTGETVKFDRCKFFLNEASCSKSWPEDTALKEPPLTDVRAAVDPSRSKMLPLFNTTSVRLGDTLEVEVVLYDGFGRLMTRGGDNILVWMQDKRRRASVNGHVKDKQDGRYLVRLPVWWEGDLEIVAVIIAPRQIRETAFRRRYRYPPDAYNQVVFRNKGANETTACNTVPHLPGYDVICNLTSENYGNAWFCGKPGNSNLSCSDWTTTYMTRITETTLTQAEMDILEKFQGAKFLPIRIHVAMKTGKTENIFPPRKKCHEVSVADTWKRRAPAGYFYGNHWIDSLCHVPKNLPEIKACLEHTNVLLLGDSTLRQWRDVIRRYVDCQWKRKPQDHHEPQTCFSSSLNYTLTWGPHDLPFSTGPSPRTWYKPFNAYLADVDSQSRYIIVLHAYAHYIPMHSSVLKTVIQSLVTNVEQLLARNPNVVIAIKGPHSYASGPRNRVFTTQHDIYTEIYQAMIKREFSRLKDKVIFFDFLDMTRAMQCQGVHAPTYVITESVNQFFGQIRGMFKGFCK